METIPTISKAQLAQLNLLEGEGATAQQRLSQKHHLLARYLAKGYDIVQAAVMSGYSTSAARDVENSPAFQELLFYYQKEQEPFKEQMIVKFQAFSHEVLDEIMDRLSDPEERKKMTLKQLETLLALATDKVGPASVKNSPEGQMNVSIAVRLEAARKRTLSPIIEGEVVQSGPPQN